ncbi:fibrillin-1-like isoform X3 [Eriocheir sinensis]|uniref:fibrillin-1-like isoform X3 n=1 Tax=Eriocheir sinensis TaxID=95602 RepID=UPI0021C89B00|nr:fibrillin-1-like isoform X3 [Eriocheir sinensis]
MARTAALSDPEALQRSALISCATGEVLPRGESALEVCMSPLASCEPDCTGTDSGDKVADPQNCTNYYLCFSGQPLDHPNSCGSTSHFDPDAHDCVAGTECEPVCGGGGSGCAITCYENLSVVSNPFDCHTYYICNPTEPVLVRCSDEYPFFDGTDCTKDDTFCCPPYCGVNCDGGATVMVPDPDDCGLFYVCEDGVQGYPGDDHHYKCGDGHYFNITLGNCEEGDPNSCTTLCEAATGTTTTTPTTPTTPSTGDCVTTFTCPAAGDFPACQTCQPQYFNCAGAGVSGVMTTCPGDSVFNPTPGYGFCVLPANCPYPHAPILPSPTPDAPMPPSPTPDATIPPSPTPDAPMPPSPTPDAPMPPLPDP